MQVCLINYYFQIKYSNFVMQVTSLIDYCQLLTCTETESEQMCFLLSTEAMANQKANLQNMELSLMQGLLSNTSNQEPFVKFYQFLEQIFIFF